MLFCAVLLLQVVAFGEGHSSWVMRVQFDPWSCGEATSSAGPPGGLGGVGEGKKGGMSGHV